MGQVFGGRSKETENNDKTMEGQSASTVAPSDSRGTAKQAASCMEGMSPFAKAAGPEASHTANEAKYFIFPSGEPIRCRLMGAKKDKHMAAASIMAFKRISLF